MPPILAAGIGLIVGLVAMWLILRFTVGKREQEQRTRLSKQAADLEQQRAKDRDDLGKLDSRLQHRDREVADLRERLAKAETQLREREQARISAETQSRASESARSDLERALTRLEQQVKDRDAAIQQLQAADLAREGTHHAQQQTLAELRSALGERDRQIAVLAAHQAQTAKQLAESDEIITALRTNIKAESNDAMGLRQAIKRQQAEINNLRQRLAETTNQLANRNERMAQLQTTLAERKKMIADLRKRLDLATRAQGESPSRRQVEGGQVGEGLGADSPQDTADLTESPDEELAVMDDLDAAGFLADANDFQEDVAGWTQEPVSD